MTPSYFTTSLFGILIMIQCLLGYRHIPPPLTLQSKLALKAYSPEKEGLNQKKSTLLNIKRMLAVFSFSFMTLTVDPAISVAARQVTAPATPNKGFQTKTGLKYFDLLEGEKGMPSPRYGQLVSFHYTGYYRATPSSPLDAFDSTFSRSAKQSFLHKHGNGRVIRGIDEGLHTMKVGGKRR
jgi:FKBP-type peptidyl-prolyl cis-trans isomerase